MESPSPVRDCCFEPLGNEGLDFHVCLFVVVVHASILQASPSLALNQQVSWHFMPRTPPNQSYNPDQADGALGLLGLVRWGTSKAPLDLGQNTSRRLPSTWSIIAEQGLMDCSFSHLSRRKKHMHWQSGRPRQPEDPTGTWLVCFARTRPSGLHGKHLNLRGLWVTVL